MNTILSAYNGLSLLILLVTVALVVAFNLNGYSFRRGYCVMRGTHVVSRHYTSRKAHQVFHQITNETNTGHTGTYDVIPTDCLARYREVFAR